MLQLHPVKPLTVLICATLVEVQAVRARVLPICTCHFLHLFSLQIYPREQSRVDWISTELEFQKRSVVAKIERFIMIYFRLVLSTCV